MPDMTTLCYLENGTRCLMLHRVKKEEDLNRDKWLGIGGHFEAGESPEECILRETREETGLLLQNPVLRGIVTFVSGGYTEYMFLFTASRWEGQLTDCDEGTLEWVEKEKIFTLPLWEGDRLFLHLLWQGAPFFSLKLVYDGDRLVQAFLNGAPASLQNPAGTP